MRKVRAYKTLLFLQSVVSLLSILYLTAKTRSMGRNWKMKKLNPSGTSDKLPVSELFTQERPRLGNTVSA